MTPVVLHVVRPYSSEDEYLAAEAWTIDARGMLLINQREVELDRSVVFDVALANGSKVIRAEGRAIGFQPPSEGNPGGLRIRFRRFGAQTKAFIDRALSAREQSLSASLSSRPPAAPPASAPPAAAVATASVSAPPAAPPLAPPVTETLEAQSKPAFSHPGADPRERSGVHRRPAGPVDTPQNRAELLARLRDRATKLTARVDANQDERSVENG
ncbi:MAG TPA: hypothetical protein VG937_36060 [Polyangiaceae bacterium]|nr:hypothetical protein [Polyangiaceae bacterium]